MELAVLNTKGEKTGKSIKLASDVFGIEPNDHVIWLDVKRYRNAQRQGTHKSKERGEIAGSTRKIKRQKGTGTARAGSIKSPLFRGGGTVFGPRPRNYDIKVNKKVSRLARKSALTYKAKENEILALDAMSMGAPKTQEFLSVMKNLKLDNKKTLMLVPEMDGNVNLSARNLENHNVQVANFVSTYEILDCDRLILVGNAHEVLASLLNK
ncbi:MAG: 50S ribosomal protein L4 [Flavobacteriales bacterium]|nr:50S ribosomal protein L4 [Flavobacteriales bacterium]